MINKETLRTNTHRAKRRQDAKDYLGNVCALCKSDKDLEFDHIVPALKEFNISEAIANNKAWAKLVVELDKCQLLCSDCHEDKTTKEQSVDHGEGITGKKNCHCSLCAPLKKEYMKQWHEAH